MTTSLAETFMKKLQISEDIFNYWIFIYSAEKGFMEKKLDPNMIHIFSFSLHTPFKNRGLYLFQSHKQLDLSIDDDLGQIIKTYDIRGVQSVSELNISANTNIICLEVKNRKYKKLHRTKYLFFYTIHNSPSYYVNHLEYFDEEQTIIVPQNRYLLTKLKLHIPKIGCITTNVLLNKVFKFLYEEQFQEKLKEYKDIKTQIKDYSENLDALKDMFQEMAKKRKLELEKSELSSFNSDGSSTSKSVKSIDDEEEQEESEEEEDLNSSDSDLSFYSYQKKYGLPVKVNIKDI